MSENDKELKKNGFMKQKQADYFAVRLKSVGGQFTSDQLCTIHRAAEIYGKGYIHLTSRQGIEIPFIHLNSIEEIKKFLAEGGVSVGFSGPRVRTITACQGSAICKSGLIDTQKLAKEIDARYGGRNLPHKFKIGLTGCPNNCLKAAENDLGIRGAVKPNWNSERCIYCGACQKVCPQKVITVNRNEKTFALDETNCIKCGKCVKVCKSAALQGKHGVIIFFGGLYGKRIAIGKQLLPIVFDEEKILKIVDTTLKYFEENAKSGERFRNMLDRIGWGKFTEEIVEAEAN